MKEKHKFIAMAFTETNSQAVRSTATHDPITHRPLVPNGTSGGHSLSGFKQHGSNNFGDSPITFRSKMHCFAAFV